jgi:hypothetical protein
MLSAFDRWLTTDPRENDDTDDQFMIDYCGSCGERTDGPCHPECPSLA